MPLFGARTYALLSPASPTYSFPTANRVIGNDEFLCAEIGQVGTQFDGPGHIGMKLKMADGKDQDVYYNGFTAAEMYSPYGLQKLGIENVKPILTRGILIDLAAYKNHPSLPARRQCGDLARAQDERPPAVGREILGGALAQADRGCAAQVSQIDPGLPALALRILPEEQAQAVVGEVGGARGVEPGVALEAATGRRRPRCRRACPRA